MAAVKAPSQCDRPELVRNDFTCVCTMKRGVCVVIVVIIVVLVLLLVVVLVLVLFLSLFLFLTLTLAHRYISSCPRSQTRHVSRHYDERKSNTSKYTSVLKMK